MGTAAKPPPFVCFKWPWGPSLNASHSPSPSASPSPSPCGDLELPWLFKSIRTVAQGLLIAGDLPSPSTGNAGHGARLWRHHPGPAAVEADRGDAEQRALAAALLSGKAATVLEFYSPRCRLCSSLQGLVRELEDGADGCASFVLADAEDDRWLPELLHYDVRYVPCFVLLDKKGRALAKTGVPSSRQHVIAGLHHLLNMKQPSGVEAKKSRS